jgi:hypothetical protein
MSRLQLDAMMGVVQLDCFSYSRRYHCWLLDPTGTALTSIAHYMCVLHALQVPSHLRCTSCLSSTPCRGELPG